MDTEYTLEVWDGITGQWYVADAATSLDALELDSYRDGIWRIIRTEVVRKSATQPIGS